ncbi:hypothetical protein [Paenibacillus silvisoli]|uniref:hypothetical protein n=1 Tax=Paenibacillus silvisoli TaxID=3110539 RepID=UPI002805B617|nr:hypothetical protein [Paenibacillus silvisoli]
MSEHNSEKYLLENAAVNIFVQIYNQSFPGKLTIQVRQERPDVILAHADQEFSGLEITHLFYDSLQAKILLGRSEDDFDRIETMEKSIYTLNELIKKKERIYKDIGLEFELSLLIRNASPIYGMKDFLKHKDSIYKPFVFTNIWFLSRDGNDEWLLTDLLQA